MQIYKQLEGKGSLVLNDCSQASSFSVSQRMDIWGPQAVHQDLSHLSPGQTVTLSSLNDKRPQQSPFFTQATVHQCLLSSFSWSFLPFQLFLLV